MILWTLHCSTFVYEGVIAHVRGRKNNSGKVRNPVIDLIMTRRDEASLFTVKGVEYQEFGVASVTVPG